MCGRYALISDSELAKRFDKPIIGGYAVNPRYNVAPTQNAPVITAAGIEVMRWGLMPPWLKDPRAATRMINARAENLLERPAYKTLVSSRRCLVPASGFYEWRTTALGKQPYYIFVKDQPLISFAGLYTQRLDGDGRPVRSFTIITTRPNELVARIHDRMPVILSAEDEQLWLDASVTDSAAVLPLLGPFPAQRMDLHPVGPAVNSTRRDSPDLIDRVPGLE